jgi:hypothetical protein
MIIGAVCVPRRHHPDRIRVLYLIKPDIYRRWFWKRTDVAQRMLSPEQYLVLMRVLTNHPASGSR